VYYLVPTSSSAETESKSERQLAQLLPWVTEEKKTPELNAPAAPPSTAAPKPTPAPAPSASPKGPESAPGWAVNCSSNVDERGLTCRLSQTLIAKESGRTLTNVAFVLPPENKSPEVVLGLPLGLYVPAGASYQVDGNAPQRLSIRTCDRNGCYATAVITPGTMSALRKGKQLKVDFTNLAEKPVSLALSLEGFGSAYEKIQVR
jgi:invasion protein IalB